MHNTIGISALFRTAASICFNTLIESACFKNMDKIRRLSYTYSSHLVCLVKGSMFYEKAYSICCQSTELIRHYKGRGEMSSVALTHGECELFSSPCDFAFSLMIVAGLASQGN